MVLKKENQSGLYRVKNVILKIIIIADVLIAVWFLTGIYIFFHCAVSISVEYDSICAKMAAEPLLPPWGNDSAVWAAVAGGLPAYCPEMSFYRTA